MEPVKINNQKNALVWMLSLCTLLAFVFSCQEEENAMGKTQQTYEELAAEVESLSAEMKLITDNYPDYRIDMRQMTKKDIDARSFEEVISGIDNGVDKRKISELHYQMHQVREKMFGLPDASGVYTMVDEQPTPEEGLQEFYTYIQKNLEYPAQARRMGIEGRVFIQFVVDQEGAITEVEAIKGIGAGCDEAAERVLKNAAAWNPGYQQGQAVKVRMVLPITFRLG